MNLILVLSHHLLLWYETVSLGINSIKSQTAIVFASIIIATPIVFASIIMAIMIEAKTIDVAATKLLNASTNSHLRIQCPVDWNCSTLLEVLINSPMLTLENNDSGNLTFQSKGLELRGIITSIIETQWCFRRDFILTKYGCLNWINIVEVKYLLLIPHKLKPHFMSVSLNNSMSVIFPGT